LSKEIFRICNSQYGGQTLIQLTENEQFTYKLFYASIASALGFVFSSKYVLSNLSRNQTPKRRLYFKKAMNDGEFSSWGFLLWIGKPGAILGLFYMMFPFQYDIDFLKEFPELLILLPLVIFLSSWTSLRIALGRNSLKQLLFFSLVFASMSLTFSFHNFLDIDLLNKALMKNNLSYPYRLETPKSNSYKDIKSWQLDSNNTPIFIANNATKLGSYKVMVGEYKDETSLNHIIEKLDYYIDFADRNESNITLYIDKSIPMSFIDSVKLELRKNHFLHINFMVGVRNSKYPSSSPLFKDFAISQWLFPYSAELDSFLYIAEKLDFTKQKIKIIEPTNIRFSILKNSKAIQIEVNESGLLVNNKKVDEVQMARKLKTHIEKYAPNYTIVYSHSERVSYGNYVETLGSISYTINSFREEMAQKLFNNKFDYLFPTERQKIKKEYPKNILEWTKEEKRLIELLKKQQEIRK
jgi:biopolymer transport protein ExbD